MAAALQCCEQGFVANASLGTSWHGLAAALSPKPSAKTTTQASAGFWCRCLALGFCDIQSIFFPLPEENAACCHRHVHGGFDCQHGQLFFLLAAIRLLCRSICSRTLTRCTGLILGRGGNFRPVEDVQVAVQRQDEGAAISPATAANTKQSFLYWHCHGDALENRTTGTGHCRKFHMHHKPLLAGNCRSDCWCWKAGLGRLPLGSDARCRRGLARLRRALTVSGSTSGRRAESRWTRSAAAAAAAVPECLAGANIRGCKRIPESRPLHLQSCQSCRSFSQLLLSSLLLPRVSPRNLSVDNLTEPHVRRSLILYRCLG
mmetsp:Transcript_8631/g.14118  ORF Transcript_8631/g.14118 Transcript_8631/m.14118 type:complete len:317 (+) Transcript_8631:154-1104(+)